VNKPGFYGVIAAILVATALPLPGAHAQTSGERKMSETVNATEAENKALVEAGFAAWAAGTGSPYDLLADDAIWTIVGRSDASKTYQGKAAFINEVIRPFNARMRERLKPTIRRLYAEGDTVIIFFDASGIARDGQPYANTYAWFLEMRDKRVVRAHAFFDSIAFNDFWRRVHPAE
jgi:uncharacterized protein